MLVAAVAALLAAGAAACGTPDRPAAVPATDRPSTAASPVATPTVQPPRLDVRKFGQLHTTDGRTLPLTGIGGSERVTRTPAGWLFAGTKGDTLLLRPDGTVLELHLPEEVAVSADGQSVAWTAAGKVTVARLTTGGLRDRVSTPVPAKTRAVTWIGHRVVLAQAYAPWCCGSDHLQHDVWDPAKGPFVARWTRGIAPVYGPLPDGAAGAGLVQKNSKEEFGAGCLARLDGVRDMSVTKRTCLPGLTWTSNWGLSSPTGRHLAEAGDDESIVLADLAGHKMVGNCPASQPLAWEDDTNLLAETAEGKLVRCTVGKSGADAVPDVVLDAASDQALVPRIGVV
ncbi:hypothetical protein BG844_29340 [Couchioplanes caeruleus subsp. caeruleus]|uniref:Uncharacterized protein n=1 Tax=Couchioplanes caeruleus subsp. caeruleus TaxID=56427 RepID=A0A1K0GJ31_9ACTN|nr:hypothetical protein BG844_29340 [Couchioplanes caeruleus subsp. caeruleus]